jgi:hypothetical protein
MLAIAYSKNTNAAKNFMILLHLQDEYNNDGRQ